MLTIGCDGATLATSGVIPEVTRTIFDAVKSGENNTATAAFTAMRVLFETMIGEPIFQRAFELALNCEAFTWGIRDSLSVLCRNKREQRLLTIFANCLLRHSTSKDIRGTDKCFLTASAPQLSDRLAAPDNRSRTTAQVIDCGMLVIDLEVIVDRCQKILRAHAALNWSFTALIGGTNHLPRSNASTGKEHRACLRPVISSRLHHASVGASHSTTTARHMRDSRSAAKFSCDHNHDSLGESSNVDILDRAAETA